MQPSEISQISEFGSILLFIITGIVFVLIGVGVAALIRPSRPNPEKLSVYECGEDAVGSAWVNMNSRYYLIALLFVLFEVEIIYLFPVATIYGNHSLDQATDGSWTIFALIEMLLFLGMLFIGLVYVWRKGYLDWNKPEVKAEVFTSKVPHDLYKAVNDKYTEVIV
jgi:NADH-quinone oxidoreductase subunit A